MHGTARIPHPTTTVREDDISLFVALELSRSTWLLAMSAPHDDKISKYRVDAGDSAALLKLLSRLSAEAQRRCGRPVKTIAIHEAGLDGFWVHRLLEANGVESHVVDAASIAVNRRHRRAKTDRIDTAMLRRGFLGWLRGEPGHCSMAIVPTLAEEDAKRPHRERESLVQERTSTINRMKSILIQFGVRDFNPVLRKAAQKLHAVQTPEGVPLPPNAASALRRNVERLRLINEQIKAIERSRVQHLKRDPTDKFNAMVFLLVRIIGLGVETAEQLVREILSRNLRNRKAVARYAGLTGSPDESGARRREKGLSRSGNGRVRSILIQLSWRLLQFQPDSELVLWFNKRTAGAKGSRKPMIVALARKLIITLWRYVNTGMVPNGFKLRSAG